MNYETIIIQNEQYEITLAVNNLDDETESDYQKYIVDTPYENFKFDNVFEAIEFYEDQVVHSEWWTEEQDSIIEYDNLL